MKKSWRVLIWLGLGVVVLLAVPVVVVGWGQVGAFDIFGNEDPLGDPSAGLDLVVCVEPSADRFASDDLAELVLSVPDGYGGDLLPPGVDGYGMDRAGPGDRIGVIEIDMRGNASDEDLERLVAAFRSHENVFGIHRHALGSICAAGAATTTTTGD